MRQSRAHQNLAPVGAIGGQQRWLPADARDPGDCRAHAPRCGLQAGVIAGGAATQSFGPRTFNCGQPDQFGIDRR